MSATLRELGRKVEKGLQSGDQEIRRRWHAGVGLLFMAVFVVASLAVNQTVLALNQAAGNYGYRSGSYGYQASATTSDQVPSAPTSFSATPSQTTTALSWTAPTTTTASTAISTGGGSIASYNIHYSTSSLSSCSGGTSTTSTSASKDLSSLTANTTYYVAVCAVDNNDNASSALTGSFTTLATGGGGGGGGGSSVFSAPPAVTPSGTVPATPAVPGVAPAVPATPASVAKNAAALVTDLAAKGIVVARSATSEATNAAKVASSATEFRVTLSVEVKTVAANFVTYGTSSVTAKLGSGERLAVVRDLFETLGDKVQANAANLLKVAEEISAGQKPTVRNLTKERAQVGTALAAFRRLTGRDAPNFKNVNDDLAWNTILYRVRFTRDLAKERAGIAKFRTTFNKIPRTPFDWAVVRAWAYALK